MHRQKIVAKIILQLFSFFIIYYSFLSIALAAQIQIAWDANTESDLAGYKVYYGTASRNYGTPIDIGNVRSIKTLHYLSKAY